MKTLLGAEIKPIGELLRNRGLISDEDLKNALALQQERREKLGRILVDLGYVSERDVVSTLSDQLGIPVFTDEFPAVPVEPAALPYRFLRTFRVLPVHVEGNVLSLVMADPLDTETQSAVRLRTSHDIRVFLAAESQIAEELERLYGGEDSPEQKLIETLGEGFSTDDENIEHLRDLASEVPVIRMVNLIISRIKLMAKLNIAERRLPQDGRIKLKVLGREIDLRISTLPTMYGESVVMRILDKSNTSLMDLRLIGFPESLYVKVCEMTSKPHGIFLVTGPTGSGKTTTLYSAMKRINIPDRKIITIEDPVEYQMDGVNQIHVNPQIGLTFATGLRHIVRQDPDVIMIGEIRDLETAEIAIRSALTGHLVFSTLHTNDATSAVTRLIDMGVEDYLLASSLIGVLAQRLVRVNCGNCKRPERVPAAALRDSGFPASDTEFVEIQRGAGCERCSGTGFESRIGIFELLDVDEAMRNLIVTNPDANVMRNAGLKSGMLTLRDDGWTKVLAGLTTPDEVLRVTQEV